MTCACGCGEPTGIRPGRGPATFRPGHNNRAHVIAAGLRATPRNRCYVPVAPLQRAFEASGLTAYTVALRAGWENRGSPDGYRVLRTLGLRAYHEGNGYDCQRFREWVRVPTALILVEALGLAPVEIGL